jgi:hypothetical protein
MEHFAAKTFVGSDCVLSSLQTFSGSYYFFGRISVAAFMEENCMQAWNVHSCIVENLRSQLEIIISHKKPSLHLRFANRHMFNFLTERWILRNLMDEYHFNLFLFIRKSLLA